MESHVGSSSSSKRRRRQNTSEGIDYISHLPKAILFHILSFLPLKDCIVMSILSKEWKDLWTHIPQLNFSELEFIKATVNSHIDCPICAEVHGPYNPFECLRHSINNGKRKFIELVDRTLRLHSCCTINNFRLSFLYDPSDGCTRKINSWVHFAMTRNIKELELNFSEEKSFRFFNRVGLAGRPTDLAQPYELPSCHFAPKILTTLILNFCKLQSSSFRAFTSLKSLCLRQVLVLDCTIGYLLSICPTLEDLSLEYCVLPKEFLVYVQDMKIKKLSVIHCIMDDWQTVPIDISTPYLLSLTIVGTYLRRSSVRKALHLVDVIIDIRQKLADSLRGCRLGSLLTNVRHCKTLNLTSWCIQVLPTGNNLLQQLPAPLHNLNHLRLGVCLVKQELPGISCLLRSCPNLECLTLDMSDPLIVDWDMFQNMIPNVYDFEEHSYWESQTLPYRCLGNCLKKIKINRFVGSSSEMQMVQFLLKSAAVLENIEIYSTRPKMFIPRTLQEQINFMCFQSGIFHKLLNFPKASSQAEIAIFNVHTEFQGKEEDDDSDDSDDDDSSDEDSSDEEDSDEDEDEEVVEDDDEDIDEINN